MHRRWQLLLIVLAALCMTCLGIFIALANNIEEPPRKGERMAVGTVVVCNLLWLIPWIIVQRRSRDRAMLRWGMLLFALIWSPFVVRSFHHPRFDSETWKRSVDPNRSYAGYPAYGSGYMVTDIIESRVCIGKTLHQIEEILGTGHFEEPLRHQDPQKTFRFYFYSNKVLFDGCDKLGLCFENGICTSASFAGCD